MPDRSSRQPFHARKGKGLDQPTPLSLVKAGTEYGKNKGNIEALGKNPADAQQNKKPVIKLGTGYKV